METTLAWAEVSSELAVICWLVLESSSLALATCTEFSVMAWIMRFRLPLIWLMAVVRSPSSSRLWTFRSSRVRSPAAMASAWLKTDWVALEMLRLRKMATKIPIPNAASVVKAEVRMSARFSAFRAS